MPKIAVVLALLFALGCSDDETHPADGPSAPPSGRIPNRSFGDYTEGRYCEVLVAFSREGGLVGDVWNSLPFGLCPQEQWEMLDAAQIKQDFPDAALVLLNGPRYFVMQELYQDAAPTTPELHTFGEIQMVLSATVAIDPSQSAPYNEHYVDRRTTFRFKAGARVFEIITPDGRAYVMQSFSRNVDATLTFDELPGLGARIALPTGWLYDSRILDTDLDVIAHGVATVIQDDLQNTYQLLEQLPQGH